MLSPRVRKLLICVACACSTGAVDALRVTSTFVSPVEDVVASVAIEVVVATISAEANTRVWYRKRTVMLSIEELANSEMKETPCGAQEVSREGRKLS